MIHPGTFNIVILAWIGFAVILFPILLKIPAPYGRHSQKKWGATINNRVGWFVMELPALAVFLSFFLAYSGFKNVFALFAAFLWTAHYFHRVLIFPFRLRTRGKQMPLVIVAFAFVFNLVNASLNGYWLGNLYPQTALTGFIPVRILTGVVLFIAGYSINQYHDRLLIHLRKRNNNGYKIPFGGLFRFVSCPNFFGEIMEWGGFAILTWGLPSLSFFIWTAVNLVPRALDHHKWYLDNFKDYPKNRKAVIPFLL